METQNASSHISSEMHPSESQGTSRQKLQSFKTQKKVEKIKSRHITGKSKKKKTKTKKLKSSKSNKDYLNQKKKKIQRIEIPLVDLTLQEEPVASEQPVRKSINLDEIPVQLNVQTFEELLEKELKLEGSHQALPTKSGNDLETISDPQNPDQQNNSA